MYWTLDVHKYRKGNPHSVENTFYFRSKVLAENWLKDYNGSHEKSLTVARDLREERDETTILVLDNFFETYYGYNRVAQTDLMKFCKV